MPSAQPFVRRRLSLTPLIDVIFLLLLFFMLSSSFARFGEIEISPSANSTGQPNAPADRVFIQLGANRLTLNGRPVALDEIATQLDPGRVLVSLDSDASAQRLVDLLAELRGADGLNVTVLE
ncbi:MAG: biopolymer transporter ExbD [Pseudomonadota bacterium]